MNSLKLPRAYARGIFSHTSSRAKTSPKPRYNRDEGGLKHLRELCKLIRYDILTSTTQAGSGHPTSSLSAVELLTTLFFDGFLRFDIEKNEFDRGDKVIFSKGHASPLLYSLYHVAGLVSCEDLMKLRTFSSPLEGHPTPRFPFVEVATGSLGQGLSIGVGETLGIKLRYSNHQPLTTNHRLPHVFVLLGDSEMAEGQVWEAMELASYHRLNNLVAILDVNRLGQRGETMLGWDIKTYARRAKSFGWNVITLRDGHNLNEVRKAFKQIDSLRKPVRFSDKPVMIIAKTIKGKGVSFLENKDGWHGKPVPKDMSKEALKELGKVDLKLRGIIQAPKYQKSNIKMQNDNSKLIKYETLHVTRYTLHESVATREAYGDALVDLGKQNEKIVVLDAETSNSTYADKFKKVFPDRFFEMFIAEQNMISAAVGFSKQGYIPFASSFAAFLTRAFDQIRMGQYSEANIKIIGSHAGVSIGSDGASQMALEDIAMMRSILESVVLYPSDAVSTFKLTHLMSKTNKLCYMRTTREKTPILYPNNETFAIGGSKTLKQNAKDKATIITTGITLHEALKAYEQLKAKNIHVRVIDLYSIKPIDTKTLVKAAQETKHIIVVEDHYPAGGIGEAVQAALANENVRFHHLAVTKIPHSGTPAELLRYEEIDAEAIVKTILGTV